LFIALDPRHLSIYKFSGSDTEHALMHPWGLILASWMGAEQEIKERPPTRPVGSDFDQVDLVCHANAQYTAGPGEEK
jgi:hypothetical protein